MSESGAAEIPHPKNETTQATQGWFKRNAETIKKWVLNTGITAVGEFFSIMGGILTPVSIAATLMTANPLFLLGAAPSVIGGMIEWGGAKNAEPLEKGLFISAKAALAGGGMYAGPLAPFAMGLSAASGLLVQRHRT